MRAIRRLKAIGPRPLLLARYLRHHATRGVRQRRLRASYELRVAAPPPGATLELLSVHLPVVDALPADLRPAVDRLRVEADQAVRHEIDLLGSGLVELGSTIDWQQDFKSGYRWPAIFYQDLEVTRLDDQSDAKAPWELSRCHHFLTLARAAVVFREDRYREALEDQFLAWIDANPPGIGINWVNAMEVGLRAVNWIWALSILESWQPLSQPILDRVTSSLQSHGRHIESNLEGTPYLRSNHFLADVLGLLALGATISGDPAATRWRSTALAALEREIGEQVHPDGLGFEASLPYHAFALEMFLLARHIAVSRQTPLSRGYDERLALMLDATAAVRHPNGRLPQFGDSDSGRVLPAGSDRPPTADNLLWLGAAILERPAPMAGPPHEEVAWTLGVDAWKSALRRPQATSGPPTDFPHGGVYVLAATDVHAVVRAGDVGQNGNGGHAHNDCLSFELSYETPVVVDSGTYLYTADPEARNAFRATRAHNTVVVAGAEINPIDARLLFELRQFARPRISGRRRTAESTTLVVSHDGYRRLDPPAEHRRTFRLDHASKTFEVNDELLGSGHQSAESLLHLAVGIAVEATGPNEFILRRPTETALRLSFRGALDVDVEAGFVSDRFGVRSRAAVLVARVAGDLPLEFGYRFVLADPE